MLSTIVSGLMTDRLTYPISVSIFGNMCIITAFIFTGVAIGVGFIFASLVYSISRNPSQRDELLRFSFIGFSLVEASGLIGLVMSFVLLFGL